MDTDRQAEQVRLAALRSGDETAFAELVDTLHGRLLALARTFTRSPALAEDIAQETWMAVIRGLPAFEGRCALSTWIFSILVRRGRTLAAREARRAGLPLETDGGHDGVNGEWVPGAGKKGLWESRPAPWDLQDPAALLQSREALAVIQDALERLPEAQRRVVLLRDVEDVGPDEICNMLEISRTNQRVLLHRGRARIRRALDAYVRGERGAPIEAAGRPPATDPKETEA